MTSKAAIFCHNGLGDGINMLVLANNLHINGFHVTLHHNSLGALQHWVPHAHICPYPPLEQLPAVLDAYDWYFVVADKGSEFVKELIREGKSRNASRMNVIYLYPSPHIINEPYYADCLTDPSLSVAHNLQNLCKQVLALSKTTSSPGLLIPPGLTHRKYKQRIAIHPTSAKPEKNWSTFKFVKLALHLQSEGFQPVFLLRSTEMSGWGDLAVQQFETLHELGALLYESGYFLGNDSGPGHFASALGLKTLTLFRRKASAKLWAPSFQPGVVITPSTWIPNIRGLRLRDRHWQRWVTVDMVRRGGRELWGEMPATREKIREIS